MRPSLKGKKFNSSESVFQVKKVGGFLSHDGAGEGVRGGLTFVTKKWFFLLKGSLMDRVISLLPCSNIATCIQALAQQFFTLCHSLSLNSGHNFKSITSLFWVK